MIHEINRDTIASAATAHGMLEEKRIYLIDTSSCGIAVGHEKVV